MHQFVGEIEFCKSVWRGLGSCTSVWGDWVLYKYGRRFGVFTTVWRRLGFVPVFGGDWVLYQCVEDIWFLKLPRLGSVQVCEENKVLY